MVKTSCRTAFLGLAAGLLPALLLLTACSAGGGGFLSGSRAAPDIPKEPGGDMPFDDMSFHDATAPFDDAPVYHVPTKEIGESNDISLKDIFVPSAKDGRTAAILALIDSDRLLMQVDASDDASHPGSPWSDLYLYSISAQTWDGPLNANKNLLYLPLYADTDCVIAETTTEPMVWRDGTLVFIDLASKSEKIIFEYDKGDGNLTGTHPNSIAVFEGRIYFDDFVPGNTASALYVYDIATETVDTVTQDAMNPIVFRNQVWYFSPDENGEYRILTTGNRSEVLKNDFQIGQLGVSGDLLFTTRGMGKDAALGTSLVGIFEWNADKPLLESRKGNIIFGLQVSDLFVAWETSMPHQAPCVYDVSENVILEFHDFPFSDGTFWLCEETGLVSLKEVTADGTLTGRERHGLFTKK
ncbi:MAG: hypothetical protein LBQ15_09150 [Clostridium sp.]|jgi:hypothetical protein|nr:hypothetical protein [Clostridium sp.]